MPRTETGKSDVFTNFLELGELSSEKVSEAIAKLWECVSDSAWVNDRIVYLKGLRRNSGIPDPLSGYERTAIANIGIPAAYEEGIVSAYALGRLAHSVSGLEKLDAVLP